MHVIDYGSLDEEAGNIITNTDMNSNEYSNSICGDTISPPAIVVTNVEETKTHNNSSSLEKGDTLEFGKKSIKDYVNIKNFGQINSNESTNYWMKKQSITGSIASTFDKLGEEVSEGLKINGREIVSRRPSTVSTFSIKGRRFRENRLCSFGDNEHNAVAEYDQNVLKDYWNTNVIKPSNWRRFKLRMKTGVMRRAFPTVSVYLLGHYTFSLIILTNVCSDEILNNRNYSIDESTEKILKFFYNNDYNTKGINAQQFCANYSGMQELWREKEHSMTRILTLLVGFYVGFIMRTWWSTLRYLPTIDALCMAMGSFVVIDSEVDEDDVGVKLDGRKISIRQFKKDIARYFLLSWTMCMSRISKPLKDIFSTPESFNEKRLLTWNEYKQLTTDTDDDCWLEKWSVPLIWVNKMVSTVGKDTRPEDVKGNFVEGVRFREPKEVGIANFKFKDALLTLNNQYCYRIPDLMLYCITYALYFFMFLGVFAGQGMSFHPSDKRSTFEKLICDFPFYYAIKYALLVSWLKAASDLQNPFGDDDWDVKLPVVLDFEIWKASNMLFQNIPRGSENSKRTVDQTSNWNDVWHKSFPEEVEPDMIRSKNHMNDTKSSKNSYNDGMTENKETTTMYIDVSSFHANQNNPFQTNFVE